MATYLILIYGVEDQWEAMPDNEQEAQTAGHRTLAADAGRAILYTCELDPVRRATTLHSDGAGGVLVTKFHSPIRGPRSAGCTSSRLAETR